MDISGGFFAGFMPSHSALPEVNIRSIRRIRAAAAAELNSLRLTSSL
jgi:hypothetical protein